jgi:hypothetical protein
MPLSRTRVAAYRPGSQSARVLSTALGARQLAVPERSRFRPRINDTLINWGKSNWDYEQPLARFGLVLNRPTSVARASNKLDCLRALESVPTVRTPEWTTDRNVVRDWLREEGTVVFVRTLLRANSGRGIVKLEGEGVDIPAAPLYTRYVRKLSEWRVHVMRGDAFHIQRKIARTGVEPTDWQIRSHDNGFIFQQEYNRDAWHEEIGQMAVDTVTALGLDFGAVDILWASDLSYPVVLEVNTAPGLEGRTLEKYVEKFQEIIG